MSMTNPNSTVLYTLGVGLDGPVAGMSFRGIISRGEILSIGLDGVKTTNISADPQFLALPDGVVYITIMSLPPQNDGSVVSMRLDGADPRIVLSKGQIHTSK